MSKTENTQAEVDQVIVNRNVVAGDRKTSFSKGQVVPRKAADDAELDEKYFEPSVPQDRSMSSPNDPK